MDTPSSVSTQGISNIKNESLDRRIYQLDENKMTYMLEIVNQSILFLKFNKKIY